MDFSVFGATAIAVLVLILSVWAVSVRIKDASIIDVFWGLGFVLVVWVARFAAGGPLNIRHVCILIATTLWGLRLGIHLGRRNLGKGEDFRYRAMRKKHGDRFWIMSLVTVYAMQGVLMWLVSLPVQVGQMQLSDDPIKPLVWIGLLVWLVGVLFETVGDIQLTEFRSDPANVGKVLDTGLWAWTRHPNYFGDATAWWGLWIMSSSEPRAIWTVIGPIVMTVLLRKVSGVPMLENSLSKRRPGYKDYVANTSAFFPRPPRRRSS